MHVEQHEAAADPQTKSTNWGCESTFRLLSSTATVTVYYYLAQKVVSKADFAILWRVEAWVDLAECDVWCL